MAFTSCGSDAIIEDESRPYGQPSAPGTMTFTATTGEESGTRASLDGLDIVWNADDAISVFSSADQTANNQMTLTKGATTTSGSFTGDCAKGTEYFAFYPYNSDNKLEELYSISGNTKRYSVVWNGSQQTAVANSFDPHTLMMAKTSNVAEDASNVSLAFKNVLSFIKLTTAFSCKTITLTSAVASEAVSAKALCFNLTASNILTPSGRVDAQKSVVLQGSEGADIAAGTYYIAVLPGTLTNGFSLTFSGVNGTDLNLTKSTSQSVTLNRSEALNIGEFQLDNFKQNLFFGSGTAADPYAITSYEDWVQLAAMLEDENTRSSYVYKHYTLTNDIDCASRAIPSIAQFKGYFEGNNHTIRNYRSNVSLQSGLIYRCGLFDYVVGAEIKNLNAEFIYFIIDNHLSIGGELSPFIRNAIGSKIINCHVSGKYNIELNLTNPDDHLRIGGLIAFVVMQGDNLTSEIRNCSNALNIHVGKLDSPMFSYDISLGGIAGYVWPGGASNGNAFFDRCRNTGNLCLEGKENLDVGGIIGFVEESKVGDVELYVTNCVNRGNITAGCESQLSGNIDDACAGGIVGKLDADGEDIVPHIYNCLNQGQIEAHQVDDAWAGGIIGWTYIPTLYNDPHLFNCANRGKAVAKSGAYPFVGNTGSYNVDKFAKCCHNDYKFGSEPQVPQIIADDMNKNLGSAKIHSVTENDKKWVDYSFGCCRWTGDGTTLDLDFSTSVK